MLSTLALCSTGCGSSDDVHRAGKPSGSGQCPTSIGSTQDANNQHNVLDNGLASGDYSGPDGEGMFSSICTHLGVNGQAVDAQSLEVVLEGKKPLKGVSYAISKDPSSVAIVRYAEGNNASHVWVATGGTVNITEAAPDIVGLSFDSVQLVPDDTKASNIATGTLTITSSVRPTDVLGFQPTP
jgi:hypothetical protein